MIVQIETVKLHRALATIVRFAARDPESNLCLVRIEGSAGDCELTFVATNGHMIATYRLDVAESLDEDVGVTYVAPSVTAAIAAIAPYAKRSEGEARQCALWATGLAGVDFGEGSIAIEDLRVPLQDPPDGLAFPPWRQTFVRPAGNVQTIGLNAAYVKDIAAAFVACEPTAGIFWQFGETAMDGVFARSADVEALEVMIMPVRPEATDQPDARQTEVAGSKGVARAVDAFLEAVGEGNTVTLATDGRAVTVAGKAKRGRKKASSGSEVRQ